MIVAPTGVQASPVLRETRDTANHVETVQPFGAHDAFGRLAHFRGDISTPGVEVILIAIAELSFGLLLIQATDCLTSFEEEAFFDRVSCGYNHWLADDVMHDSVGVREFLDLLDSILVVDVELVPEVEDRSLYQPRVVNLREVVFDLDQWDRRLRQPLCPGPDSNFIGVLLHDPIEQLRFVDFGNPLVDGALERQWLEQHVH